MNSLPIFFGILLCIVSFLPVNSQNNYFGFSAGYSHLHYQISEGEGFNFSASFKRSVSSKWGYSINAVLSNTYAHSVLSSKSDNDYTTNMNYLEYPDGANWSAFIVDEGFTLYQQYNFINLDPKINFGHDLILNGSIIYKFISHPAFEFSGSLGTGIGLSNNQEIIGTYEWTANPLLVRQDDHIKVLYEFQRQVKYLYWEMNAGITGKYNISDSFGLLLQIAYNFKPEMVGKVNLAEAGVLRLNAGVEFLIFSSKK